jgi:ABC-2 type transport system permease protein
MRVLDLALKDLQQLVRDWKAAGFLVVMPIAFTLLLGFILSGMGGEDDPRLPVGVLDQDGSEVSGHLLVLLEDSDVVRPVVVEDQDLESMTEEVGDGDWAAALLIPPGYGEEALSGDPLDLTIVVEGYSPVGVTSLSEIQAVVVRLIGAAETARIGAQVLETAGGSPDEAFLLGTLEQTLAAWQDPALSVETRVSGSGSDEDEGSFHMRNPFAHTSPGMMVQFAIAGLIGAAEIMVAERKSKALRRLLTTAISRPQIILGHFLAMFVMILVQIALLVVFGQLVLDVDYFREPLATLLVALTTALWVAALGLLIGALAKTSEQVVVFSMVPMFVLAGLGGAMVPLAYTGEAFQTIGHLLPSAWTMDGLQNIVVRGLGLESVLLPAGILVAYAALFFMLAVWRFRFE